MFSGITLLKMSCIFECCYEFIFGENRIEQYFGGARNQSSAHCAGVVKVRVTEGARRRGPAGGLGGPQMEAPDPFLILCHSHVEMRCL